MTWPTNSEHVPTNIPVDARTNIPINMQTNVSINVQKHLLIDASTNLPRSVSTNVSTTAYVLSHAPKDNISINSKGPLHSYDPEKDWVPTKNNIFPINTTEITKQPGSLNENTIIQSANESWTHQPDKTVNTDETSGSEEQESYTVINIDKTTELWPHEKDSEINVNETSGSGHLESATVDNLIRTTGLWKFIGNKIFTNTKLRHSHVNKVYSTIESSDYGIHANDNVYNTTTQSSLKHELQHNNTVYEYIHLSSQYETLEDNDMYNVTEALPVLKSSEYKHAFDTIKTSHFESWEGNNLNGISEDKNSYTTESVYRELSKNTNPDGITAHAFSSHESYKNINTHETTYELFKRVIFDGNSLTTDIDDVDTSWTTKSLQQDSTYFETYGTEKSLQYDSHNDTNLYGTKHTQQHESIETIKGHSVTKSLEITPLQSVSNEVIELDDTTVLFHFSYDKNFARDTTESAKDHLYGITFTTSSSKTLQGDFENNVSDTTDPLQYVSKEISNAHDTQESLIHISPVDNSGHDKTEPLQHISPVDNYEHDTTEPSQNTSLVNSYEYDTIKSLKHKSPVDNYEHDATKPLQHISPVDIYEHDTTESLQHTSQVNSYEHNTIESLEHKSPMDNYEHNTTEPFQHTSPVDIIYERDTMKPLKHISPVDNNYEHDATEPLQRISLIDYYEHDTTEPPQFGSYKDINFYDTTDSLQLVTDKNVDIFDTSELLQHIITRKIIADTFYSTETQHYVTDINIFDTAETLNYNLHDDYNAHSTKAIMSHKSNKGIEVYNTTTLMLEESTEQMIMNTSFLQHTTFEFDKHIHETNESLLQYASLQTDHTYRTTESLLNNTVLMSQNTIRITESQLQQESYSSNVLYDTTALMQHESSDNGFVTKKLTQEGETLESGFMITNLLLQRDPTASSFISMSLHPGESSENGFVTAELPQRHESVFVTTELPLKRVSANDGFENPTTDSLDYEFIENTTASMQKISITTTITAEKRGIVH